MAPVALATCPSMPVRRRRGRCRRRRGCCRCWSGRSVAGMAAAVAARPSPAWSLPSPPISGVAAAAARRQRGEETQGEDWGREAEGIGHGGCGITRGGVRDAEGIGHGG
jgi:hypothetical protein